MRAFEGMPTVEAPDTSQPRIFELRTYESHNLEKARRKIEIFNKGEIEIFSATDLTPVSFGATLAGVRLRNPTYIITHPDMAARDAHWAVDVEPAAVAVRHDVVAQAKTETRAAARRLRRKERLENAGSHAFRTAGPVVLDGNQQTHL